MRRSAFFWYPPRQIQDQQVSQLISVKNYMFIRG